MKKYIFGCMMALSSLTMPAAFGEYCCPPPPCEPICCEYDFNGFYVGGDIGVYSNTAHRNDFDGFFRTGGTRVINSTNFTAGVQVGYDMECCNKVFGLIVDWNWVNNKTHALNAAGTENHRDHFNWFTTIRGRAGVAVCDALLYVTLGAAVFHHKFRGEFVAPAGDLVSFNHHNNRWGWVAGVGTEFLCGCNWSAGVEVLYLNFSNRTRTIVDPLSGIPYRFGFSDSAYVGRFFVNYRFGDLLSSF